MRISKVLVGLAAAAGLGHLGVKMLLKQVQQNPDVYPEAVLCKEPEGEEVVITQPDGTNLRVIVAGSGPTVVLAHGLGVNVLEWNVVWGQLLKLGYRVIAFDQRGHGRSTVGSDGIGSQQMAGDYKAILEHFDVRDAILVGHSMGGFLSIVFMLTYPQIAKERLKGVVLFATFAGSVLVDAPQNRIQIPMIHSGIMDRVVQSDTYGSAFTLSLMGDNPSPAAIKASLQAFRQQPFKPLAAIVEAFIHEDYYGRLGEIQLPCVVICGRKDKTTPPWHSERMGRDIPNARNVWVEGKGHVLNWEAPEALIEVIQSF